MSAFLMSEESTSDLAYNLFKRGQGHEELGEYMFKNNMTCPEDLFKKLRWDNLRSLNTRYGDKYTKKDIGEYHFTHKDLSLVELVKKIRCWKYQSCELDSIANGKLFKVLTKFIYDCCVKYMSESEEYKNADWN